MKGEGRKGECKERVKGGTGKWKKRRKEENEKGRKR